MHTEFKVNTMKFNSEGLFPLFTTISTDENNPVGIQYVEAWYCHKIVDYTTVDVQRFKQPLLFFLTQCIQLTFL